MSQYLPQRAAVGALLLPLLFAACATQDLEQFGRAETVPLRSAGGEPVEGAPQEPPDDSPRSVLSASAADLAERDATRRAEPVLYPGNDSQIVLPAPQDPVRFVGEDVSLNFEQAPLDEVAHAILGDILNLDYVVDRPLQGRVTLRTRTPMARAELLVVLESLLKAHSALMIRGSDGRYLISGSPQSFLLQPQLSTPADTAAGYSTMIIPLQYISATAMAEVLEPLADPEAFVRVDNTRNLIMLAGTRAQLTGWLDIVSTFDVDMLAGMSVGLFPLENSDVAETVAAVQALLTTAGGEAGDIAGIVRVLPMERLNSVLVVSPRAHYLERVGSWVERLDVDPDARFEKRLYVYPVQNTTATRLAALLNSIYSGADAGGDGMLSQLAGQGGRGRRDRGGTAPGLTPESIGGGAGFGGGGGLGAAGGGQGAAGASTAFGTGGMQQGGLGAGVGANTSSVTVDGDGALVNVRVVADEENNALMIYSDGRQYEIIEAALEQLDVVATQVIIEASIMEVQLTDELRYGLQWAFDNKIDNEYRGDSRLTSGDNPLTPLTGFSYTVTNATGDITAVLNALSNESLVNVISTPSVMVLDNHTARIAVGDQIPVVQGTAVGLGGVVTENIVYRDTGVQLSVRPSVNAGGLVTMDIAQSVIDVGPIDSGANQRTFLDRTINSRVAVRSSESVVLGGLIRENSSLGDSGVPFLHKVPVFGALFGTTTTDTRRTELLVIITPRALYNEGQLRAVGDEMRERVRFLELVENPPRTGAKTYEK